MTGPGLAVVLDALEYSDAEGLVTSDTPDVSAGRDYLWQDARAKLGLDAAYFLGNVPVVYFKEFQSADEDELARLHQWLWNHNRAPLLIAVLPQEVRVYNCFTPPQPAGSTVKHPGLLQAVTLVADVLELRQELDQYRRREVASGGFVRGQEKQFRRDQRVDRRLLENLAHVRRLLIKDGLDKAVANNLLGRSIFVCYLEDREAISSDFFSQFKSSHSFRDLLAQSHQGTYQLFDELSRRFNGDLFPVDQTEQQQVKLQHLQQLAQFLGGHEVRTGQMSFWVYNFKYIPIELISAIYETFLDEEQTGAAAYYTPPEIVDFVLNEVLPVDGETDDVRILDPACGSGIFLVEAYRRLVIRKRRASGKMNLSYQELRDLLTNCIDGVDLSEDAIRVAAFSCYLALLDFLEPKRIWEEVRFPKLKGANLFVGDFFDLEAAFNERRYSLIVGNPPWQNRLTQPATEYVRRTRYPVADRSSAQAFLWRAPTLLREGGMVCLLAPSKGVLFNQSKPHREFRSQFLAAHRVRKVVDFSTFRRSLFRRAIAPMVALFYQADGTANSPHEEIIYCGPHPSPLSESLAGVVVSGEEIKRFSRRRVVDRSDVWKIALWGTPRDLLLVDELRDRFPSLKQVADIRGWSIGEGVYVHGRDKNPAPDLAEMRYVPISDLSPFHIAEAGNVHLEAEVFHRVGNRRLYAGPHTLIRGGLLSGGRLAAAFLSEDAVFECSVISLAGPPDEADLLKVVSAYVNSSLARYYHFLTSSTWGVERDVLRYHEHVSLPCAIPAEDPQVLAQITAFVNRVQQSPEDHEWQSELDELVYRAYGLTPAERNLVEDTLRTTVDQLYRGTRSRAFTPPSTAELETYAAAYAEVFEATTGGRRTLLPTIYEGHTPYRAVTFQMVPQRDGGSTSRIASERLLDDLLAKLERVATEQHSQSLYFRRNVKVFEPEAIHLVKPAERRFWTRSAGYNDADETIAQLFRAVPSSANGEPAHRR
jgi:hypothetical protein